MVLNGAGRYSVLVAVGAAFALGFGLATVLVPAPVSGTVVSSIDAARPTSEPRIRAAAAGSYGADVLSVFDGDTFEARVRLWPGLDMTTKVRLRGIDTPELKARCSEERVKAEAARDALRAMLDEGDVVIANVGLDKYGGRVVADAATRQTGDVSTALRAKGLARSYNGGRREGWCGNQF
jgi:endonuclease YncB( thermonuclease family)